MAESKEIYYNKELEQSENHEYSDIIKATQEILHEKKEHLLNNSDELNQILKTIDSINNKIIYDKEYRNKIINKYGNKAGYNKLIK